MLAFLLLQAAAPAVPTDWSVLAPLPYVTAPQITPPLVHFVADEVAAGRCVLTRPADGHYILKVDIATLVGADGAVRRVLPRAIDCPTVEQYSAGLIQTFARANLAARTAANRWYRATIVYDWAG